MAGLVVERIGVGGAQVATYLLALAVVAVVHDRDTCALDLGHAAGVVVQVLACLAADGEGVAHLVVGACHACDCAQAVVGRWIGVDLRGAADFGTHAVTRTIVAIAVDHGTCTAILECGQPTKRVVGQLKLWRRVTGRGQVSEVANRVEAEANLQAACVAVLNALGR